MQPIRFFLLFLLGIFIFSLASCKNEKNDDAAIAKRYCSLEEKCYPEDFFEDYDNVQECVDELLEDAELAKKDYPECYKAEKNRYNCVSKLSCEKLGEYKEKASVNYPCASYDRESYDACGWYSSDLLPNNQGTQVVPDTEVPDISTDTNENDTSSDNDDTDPETDPLPEPVTPVIDNDFDATARRLCLLDQQCDPEDFYWWYDDVQDCTNEILESTKSAEEALPNCGIALKNLYFCLSNLSCNQLEEYIDETTPNYPCASQEQKVDETCWGDWDDDDWDDIIGGLMGLEEFELAF